MLSLGCTECTLISGLVVTNLFMHSFPGMNLLYLAALFYTEGEIILYIYMKQKHANIKVQCTNAYNNTMQL